jgi:hypothetical protein
MTVERQEEWRMSAASEPDRLDPNHPLYYAPRRSSERPELRSVPAPETIAERASRPASSAISFDTELENAVSEALRHPIEPAVVGKPWRPLDTQPEKAASKIVRHPLDPEIIHEHPELAHRRMEMLGAVRRLALPVGIAAIIAAIAAVFIVITVPAWQSDGAGSSVSAVTQPTRTDPPQVIKTEVPPKPALADFQGILAPSSTNEPGTREQPGTLLQGFVQWRQNPESTAPVEK